MRVLVACEFSGRVRDAFKALGHDAWSCDLLPTEQPGQHIEDDILNYLDAGWDLMIAHPPCTHLAVSGAAWFKYKQREQQAALGFVRQLMAAPIERIAIENPVSVISSRIRKPDQIIQPWWFGEKRQKTTCLWLKDLPLLIPTDVVGPPPKKLTAKEKRMWQENHYESPGPDRWKRRSLTYQGIADAMAVQWGAT